MIRALILAPYDLENTTHVVYMERVFKDSLERGEAPFAAHIFYSIYLDYDDIRERAIGSTFTTMWIKAADVVAVYTDYSRSVEMEIGVKEAVMYNKVVAFRSIGMNPQVHRA